MIHNKTNFKKEKIKSKAMFVLFNEAVIQFIFISLILVKINFIAEKKPTHALRDPLIVCLKQIISFPFQVQQKKQI